jgi:hypothetical protein
VGVNFLKIYNMIKKEIKNDGKYYWTNHVKEKMLYYGLSDSLVKRILRFPKRTEEGIAPDTIAVMKSMGSKKNPYEAWVMYQVRKNVKKIKDDMIDILDKLSEKEILDIIKYKPQIVIISAWKYPGVTEKRNEIPIPEDVKKLFGLYHL